MPCVHPLHGYRVPGAQIRFHVSGAHAGHPITISCSQCVGCRLERSRQWAVRLMHEAQTSSCSAFLTLTYDDDHLPVDPEGFSSLNVKHWQDFAKRARKKLGPFRFFHCGEYGEKHGRPHYHCAIFNQDFRSDRKHTDTTDAGDFLYESETLNKLWGHGRVWIGELTFQSAAYVARYIMKKQTGENAWKKYGIQLDKTTGEIKHRLAPEYITMSRRPGIGKAWIDKFMSDVYPHDHVIVNGHEARPPKFYDAQLEKVKPELLEQLKARRAEEGEKHEKDQTPERLAQIKTCIQARMSNFKRDKN